MSQRNSSVWLLLWVLSHAGIVLGETVAEYLPLADGNTWTYRVTGPNGTYNESITVQPGTTMINGVATKELEITGAPDGDAFEYWTNDEQGIRLHGAYLPVTEIGPAWLILEPPMVIAKRIMSIGDGVDSSGQAEFIFEGFGTFILDYESSSKVVGLNTINVPAGTYETIRFGGSLRIYGFLLGEWYEDASTDTTWLAKYVGQVKNIYEDSDGVEESVLISTNVQPPAVQPAPFLPFILHLLLD